MNMKVVAAGLMLLFGVSTVHAKQVTVSVTDLPFETAKSIILSQTGGTDLKMVDDDTLRKIIAGRGTFTVDDSVLPQTLRTSLEAQRKISEVTDNLKTGKEWAEMGKAIGIATREGLAAVTAETAKFADTTPGKFTMFMIAWKVMGSDFLRAVKGYLIGVPLLIVWISIFWWWLKSTYRGYWRVETKTVDGKDVKEKVWVDSLVDRIKKEIASSENEEKSSALKDFLGSLQTTWLFLYALPLLSACSSDNFPLWATRAGFYFYFFLI